MFGDSSCDFLKPINIAKLFEGSIVAYNYFANCNNPFSGNVKTYAIEAST